jgi:hypothetical protein
MIRANTHQTLSTQLHPRRSRSRRHVRLSLIQAMVASCLGVVMLTPGAGCVGDDTFAALRVDLTASPTEIELDPFFGGSPLLLALTVQNDGGAPARLTRAVVHSQSGPDVSLTVSPLGDVVPARGTLEVRVTALAPFDAFGLFTSSIALEFDDSITITVPVVALVRPAPSCDDDNPCTEDSFDGTACRHVLSVDGTPCDDENACTTATFCFGGSCVGESVRCTDGQDCTVDACDPTQGCVYEPMHERCDDEDPCTDDVCASDTGCSNSPKAPGSLCFFGGCEEVGLCVNGLCVMHDVPNGFPCSDGDACTIDDTCQEGVCAPGIAAEPGPEDPLVLVEGPVPATLCAAGSSGQPSSGCITHALEPAAVLAAHRRLDGNVQTVWRTGYVWNDTGTACDPLEPILFGANSRKLPEAAGDCECSEASHCASGVCDLLSPSCGTCAAADAEEPAGDPVPPPPPLPPVCSAAVYLTRTTTNAVVTSQLTTVTGPVAASLVDTASLLAQVAVAHVRSSSVVVVDLFSGTGAFIGEVPLARDTTLPASLWGIAQLAIDHTTTRIAVLAVPRWRDVIAQTIGCTDEGLCLGVPVEIWNALAEPLVDDAPLTPEVISLEEWPDPRCAMALGAGRPLFIEDLHVAIDEADGEQTHVALRMDPFACGDYTSNVVLSVPRIYRFSTTTPEGMATSNVGPRDHAGPPWIIEIEHIDGTTASSSTSAGVITVDVCDPAPATDDNDPDPNNSGAFGGEDCVCLDCDGCDCDCDPNSLDPVDTCTRAAIVRMDTMGTVNVVDMLLSNMAVKNAEAHTVVVNDDLFTVARTGNVLSFLGRADDGSLIYKPAPALPSDARWRGGLTAGTSIVAGLVDSVQGFDTQPGPGEPVPVNPAFPSISVVTQGFACGATASTPPPFTCSTTSDCPGGLVCDFTSFACGRGGECLDEVIGVCLAPAATPVDDAGVVDGGVDGDAGVVHLCLDDLACGDDAVCFFGESCAVDPLCDIDSIGGCPCFGVCALRTSVSDAGVLDDAGAPSDAGSIADAGPAHFDGGGLGDAGHEIGDGG